MYLMHVATSVLVLLCLYHFSYVGNPKPASSAQRAKRYFVGDMGVSRHPCSE